MARADKIQDTIKRNFIKSERTQQKEALTEYLRKIGSLAKLPNKEDAERLTAIKLANRHRRMQTFRKVVRQDPRKSKDRGQLRSLLKTPTDVPQMVERKKPEPVVLHNLEMFMLAKRSNTRNIGLTAC
jgi:hypothetical protein